MLVAVGVVDVHTQALVHRALKRVDCGLQLEPLPLDDFIHLMVLYDKTVEEWRLRYEVQCLAAGIHGAAVGQDRGINQAAAERAKLVQAAVGLDTSVE